MRVLGISSAYGGGSAAVLHDDVVAAETAVFEEHGLAAALPALVADLLERTGEVDLVAVTIGPGSFTGLRAGIAIAGGIGLAAGIPVVGVTVWEALADAVVRRDGRTLWACVRARRGRLFIDDGNGPAAHADEDIQSPAGRLAVAGNAANWVAGFLAARGVDVMLTSIRAPSAASVAKVGARRFAGAVPPRAAEPLYVDAPEAKRPAAGIRPAPL